MKLAGVLVIVGFVCSAVLATEPEQRTLTFEDRVAAQKAIEQVYWNHRIWPEGNPGPKPPLSAVMPESAIRTKVEDYLRMSALLDSFWHQPIRGEQLQAEIERMVRQTKAPETLRDLFAALRDDPFLIAECLARPALAEQMIGSAFEGDDRIHGAQRAVLASKLAGIDRIAELKRVEGDHAEITLVLDDGAAARNVRFDPTAAVIPLARDEWDREIGRLAASFGIVSTAGDDVAALPLDRASGLLDRGNQIVVLAVLAKSTTRVSVASVSWMKRAYLDWAREATSSSRLDSGALAPPAQGYSLPALPLTECTSDTWTPTALNAFVPGFRFRHTAIWTGAEMIVWGGFNGSASLNTGGRYNPSTDTWVQSSLYFGSGTNVPSARSEHTAVWTGSEMIVWGGIGNNSALLKTGGRYRPSTDTWVQSSLFDGSGSNVPPNRRQHQAVWTGSEMIVWGGVGAGGFINTGGRFSPSTDLWAVSSLTNGFVPVARAGHTAVWTGSEMIVWGGLTGSFSVVRTGGRYRPSTDTWVASSLYDGSGSYVPTPRFQHTAVWTGSEMIVWGGVDSGHTCMDGGRFNPSTDSWAASSLYTGSGSYVPAARIQHIGVWTGSEMIIWGGQDFSAFNDGGRYSPSTDRWLSSSLSTAAGANVPDARYQHTAVWTGSSDHRMIIWGGNPPTLNGGLYCACPIWYRDLDGDHHGNPAVPQSFCTQPVGYVASGDDCNDANPAVNPEGVELCNGIDENCDGVVDNGSGVLCIDNNLCTFDICHGAAGCANPPVANETTCDDGNSCTQFDMCFDGYCIGGPPLNCDDNNPCTDDSCDAAGGCVHTNNTAPCDDGNGCTIGDMCVDGSCVGVVVNCDDNNPCTDDFCDPSGGCVHTNNTAPCDDGNGCTIGDMCVDGFCVGVVVNCDDNNPCTDDFCDPSGGCVHMNNTASCDDGDGCTVDDRCSGGHCSGTPIVAPGGVATLTVSRGAISWSAVSGSNIVYDLVRGLGSELPVGSGFNETCLTPGGTTALSYIDNDPVPLIDTFWYVVRARNSCGAGPYIDVTSVPRITGECPP